MSDDGDELDESPPREAPKSETPEQATSRRGGQPSRASLRSTDDVASRPADQLVREPRRRGRPARAAETTRRRGVALAIGLVISALLVALAAGGGWIVSRLTPEPTTTETVATKPPFKMELPLGIGEYSRDANQGNSPKKNDDGTTTLSAPYSKGGQLAFVLLLARPYNDGRTFMRHADMNAVSEVQDGLCGISREHQRSGCSVIRSNTGILVLAQQDMSQEDLMALTLRVADQLDA